jgi:hypothetical protein
MSIETAPEEKPSARVDLAWAAGWIAVGAAIVTGSWTMDRLERYGATFYSAPGLVPGVLGLVIALLGVALAVRALREARSGAGRSASPWSWGNTPGVLALCLGYSVGLVGHLPFWLATFLFVTAFIAIFEVPGRRTLLMAPVYGAATSLVVTYLFEAVFLVRLP